MNDGAVVRKQKWILKQEAFEKLLARLGPTPEEAGEQYLQIQRKLVVRRIDEGEEIRTSNILVYAYGIARNVVREQWDRPTMVDVDELPALMHPADNPGRIEDERENERHLSCLRRCLADLPLESRSLILEYYQDDKSAKIDTRKKMAERLRVQHGVLRNRIFRLREKLTGCLTNCLAQ